MYQDLSICPGWPVKRAWFHWPVRFKGDSKHTGNLLSPLGAKNKHLGAALQTFYKLGLDYACQHSLS